MAKRMMEDLVFNQLLCSAGYKVDYAVGTTYSLDMSSFMALPFSLGFIEEPDEAMRSSITHLFTALRVCRHKLAVFCNFSNMKVPQGQKKIFYSLIEKSVFPINATRRPEEIVNFHPKVWIIQETAINGEGSRIKIIVMSRNLSTDNSLDAVCEFTGEIGPNEAPEKSLNKHKPLWDFLNYLKRHADESKKTMIERLISSLKKVKKFDIEDSPFDDYSFIPMGIKGHKGRETLEKIHNSREVMVISPFIDSYALNDLSDIENRTLITREMSLYDDIVENFGKEHIYIVNQQLLDNEETEQVDLHAKIYYTREKDNRQYMYLGSTNATRNGFERNVEFLIGLRYAPYQCSYDKFRENFINDDKDCKFERMIGLPPTSIDKGKEIDATKVLRQAISAIKKAEVIIREDGTYSIAIHSEGHIAEGTTLHPLMYPEKKTFLSDTVVFDNLSLENISEFYVIETDSLKRLIKVHTDNIPDTRDEAICRKIMNRDQFMDCISFLLSESKKAYIAEKMMNEKLMGQLRGKDESQSIKTPALYEELLRTAYERPDIFEDMDTFVASLPADIIPEEFKTIYDDIKKALKNYTR